MAVKSTIDRKNAELSDLSWHYEKEVNELEHELTNAKLNNSGLKTESVFFKEQKSIIRLNANNHILI